MLVYVCRCIRVYKRAKATNIRGAITLTGPYPAIVESGSFAYEKLATLSNNNRNQLLQLHPPRRAPTIAIYSNALVSVHPLSLSLSLSPSLPYRLATVFRHNTLQFQMMHRPIKYSCRIQPYNSELFGQLRPARSDSLHLSQSVEFGSERKAIKGRR